MESNISNAKEKLEDVTSNIKVLEKFVFNQTNWQETLGKNSRLARRLLMAIKEHSRPEHPLGGV